MVFVYFKGRMNMSVRKILNVNHKGFDMQRIHCIIRKNLIRFGVHFSTKGLSLQLLHNPFSISILW